jgi:arginine utilization regulatory protein
VFDESIFKMFEGLSEGISVIDLDYKIIFMNKKAAEINRVEIDKVIGKHYSEIYPSLGDYRYPFAKCLMKEEVIKNRLRKYKNYEGREIIIISSYFTIRKNKKIVGVVEISKGLGGNISKDYVKYEQNKRNIKSNDHKNYTFADIIGVSSEMVKLKAFAHRVAEFPSPVLIYGETGTGKELFVQAIHNASPRRDKAFIAQNCAALPEGLLEGLLFGTVKGSFTGAEDKIGLFEQANGGTIYLDELNSMPIELQAKLLRVLQDGYIRRLGDIEEKKVDVRIIASTNLDPEYCVNSGVIRRDLYYRLNIINIKIPDLKDRISDIPVLIEYFISKYNSIFSSKVTGVSKEALEKLVAYHWPGNIRELQNVIEGIINIKYSGIIDIEDLPEAIASSQSKALYDSLEEFEKELIVKSLKLWNNNISRTARYLSVPRQTLQNKIKKFNIII